MTNRWSNIFLIFSCSFSGRFDNTEFSILVAIPPKIFTRSNLRYKSCFYVLTLLLLRCYFLSAKDDDVYLASTQGQVNIPRTPKPETTSVESQSLVHDEHEYISDDSNIPEI